MNILVLGAVVAIAGLLIVGEVVWIFRSREFGALVRQIDELNRKLAEADLRTQALQEKTSAGEANVVAAATRLEGLTKLEQELQAERAAAEELKAEISRLKAQSKAEAELQDSQHASLAAMRAEIAQKFGAVADDVRTALAATADNARRDHQEKWTGVSGIGKELHTKLKGVGDQVNRLGSHLERLVHEFNEVTGNLEGGIMAHAQRLHDLTAQEVATEQLPNLKPIDTVVQFPRAERDSTMRDSAPAEGMIEEAAPHAVAAD